MELVVASSFVEAGIGCWDLFTGAEQLCYKLYADESPPLGLICVGERFLASSQLREPSASSGSVQYWSWSNRKLRTIASQKNRSIRWLRTAKARTTLLAEAHQGISIGEIFIVTENGVTSPKWLILVDCLRNGMLTTEVLVVWYFGMMAPC